jgi:predicted RNA-binding protein with PUA-like domain
MNYWLMKSEVTDYSISDLEKDGRTDWTGVRNYQARNFMRDSMKPGDLAFFYHSNAEPSGIAGIMKIVGPAKPDLTQFDKKSKYYDDAATKDNPRWMLREVQFVEALPFIELGELRKIKDCAKMTLLQKGSRLSVHPVTEKEWKAIINFASSKK